MKMTTTVDIPGQLLAEYEDGRITSYKFLPLASYAGYFGPPAVISDGDDPSLDVKATDGPFWKAMQQSLAKSNPFTCTWEE
jgi:hypothetical protein